MRQAGELFGKIGGTRHDGAAAQHGQDQDAPAQRRRDLPPQHIVRGVEPAATLPVADIHPATADHRDEGRRRGDTVLDHLEEVAAGIDILLIPENRLPAVFLEKP